ncbi:MAG: hypothetical protein WC845_01070 [Candidatus Staskawiczbacteria bacterium]|jgi:hypothetical protein
MEQKNPPIPINVDPNIYALTNVSISSNEEGFVMAMFSGNQVRQFLSSPKHAKRIYLSLKGQIESYEKKFGEIKTQLPMIGDTKRGEDEIGFSAKK